jgi:hypothetical protein
MRAAILSGKTCVTIVEAREGYTPPAGQTIVWDPPEYVQAGWTYAAGEWSAPPDLRSLDDVRAEALSALAAERNARVDLYTGADARARDNRLMVSVAIIDRVQSATATPEDLELMEALRQVEPLVRAHDAAAAAIRAEILAAESPADLDAIMAGLATDPRWPT